MASNNQASKDDRNSAVELARAKLRRAYGEEPNARQELAEVEADTRPNDLSKHQKFMLELKNSDKSIAAIQTEWHNYYQSLPDDEKRTVWQEFYDRQSEARIAQPQPDKTVEANLIKPTINPTPAAREASEPTSDNQAVVSKYTPPLTQEPKTRPIAKKRRLPNTKRRLPPKPKASPKAIIAKAKESRSQIEKRNLRAKHNLQSLAFGLAVGLVVILVFMFSFFNQRFIVPFISPGTASATPIILNPADASPTKQPEIIIPKINLEIPLVFSVNTTDENVIETGLESGVVHYPTTVLPGQVGNSAYFGHSSNNIFSPGKYKFAFALLHELQKGDIFYITYNKKIYVYKVYDRQIVSPSDVAVLNNDPTKIATATLITCDPPGTSLNRLVVFGEQISPNPGANQTATVSQPSSKPKQIVGNGPSLLSRLWPF